MTPPAATAATTAAEVQLAAVPWPTTRSGCELSTARAAAGTAAPPPGFPARGSAATGFRTVREGLGPADGRAVVGPVPGAGVAMAVPTAPAAGPAPTAAPPEGAADPHPASSRHDSRPATTGAAPRMDDMAPMLGPRLPGGRPVSLFGLFRRGPSLPAPDDDGGTALVVAHDP